MSSMLKRQAVPASTDHAALEAAFHQAMAFELGPLARPSNDEIAALIDEEASFPEIRIDSRGFPQSATRVLIGAAIDGLRQWRLARRRFDTELEPKRDDLDALLNLEQAKHAQRMNAKERQLHEENSWIKNSSNSHAQREFEKADKRFSDIKLGYGNRIPNMKAYSNGYALALLLIGVAEWLINYDVFYLFTGIPAIAAGATFILGVLLAFAAHAHGEVLRQWTFRFSDARGQDTANSIRLLALATVALMVVLGAAGGSRYAAVLRTLAGQSGQNILGATVMIDVDPLRDVLLSLLANFGAWIVGVFISYYCHDTDPEFMRAQRQLDRERATRDKRLQPLTEKTKTIDAELSEHLKRDELAAKSRLDSVSVELGMLTQVDKHEAAIVKQLCDEAQVNIERFRTSLCSRLLKSTRGNDVLKNEDGSPMTLAEYRAMPISIEPSLQKLDL